MKLKQKLPDERAENKDVREFYSTVDNLLKETSMATIGGFKPESGLKSWFGGNFWLPSGDLWPEWHGLPMLPLLQIIINELTYCPPLLRDFKVLQLFMDQKELPMGFPSVNGEGFLVKTYTNEVLFPREAPFAYDSPKPFPLRWGEGPLDAPTWEEIGNIVDDPLITRFVEADEETTLFHDRYDCIYATKVGGWPSYAQGAPTNMGEFIFQVTSEDKAHWGVADGGALFFHKDNNGEWTLYWDSC